MRKHAACMKKGRKAEYKQISDTIYKKEKGGDDWWADKG